MENPEKSDWTIRDVLYAPWTTVKPCPGCGGDPTLESQLLRDSIFCDLSCRQSWYRTNQPIKPAISFCDTSCDDKIAKDDSNLLPLNQPVTDSRSINDVSWLELQACVICGTITPWDTALGTRVLCSVCWDNDVELNTPEKIYRRQYRAAHRQEIEEYHRRYRAEHRLEIASRKRQYRDQNRLEISSKDKLYRETHQAEIKEKDRRYREANRVNLRLKSSLYYQAHKKEKASYDRSYRRIHRQEINARKRQNRAGASRLKTPAPAQAQTAEPE